MEWIAGIDGGGTKTALYLQAVENAETRECQVDSISPLEYGLCGYAERLKTAFERLGVERCDVASVCIGVPCFGEYPELDEKVVACTSTLFPNALTQCENDCYVGFAGAFGLKSGINVVAGTGAIAYGEDDFGNSARSNGWHSDFSDEGSGAWLGREAFALFARQMDGRAKRTLFYDIFTNELALTRDIDILDYYNRNCANNRAALAKVQEYLLCAARAGDEAATELYRQAAEHLCSSVFAVYQRLCFDTPVGISYSGGVFRAGDVLLKPFEQIMRQMIPNCVIVAPRYSPQKGAALVAERNRKERRACGI